MAENGYKVLVDELTVHKAVRRLSNPVTGEPEGWQQGAGETWFRDEVIPASQMNPEWAEALDSGEGEMYDALSTKLEPSSDEPALNEAYRMGLPFEGYDDMDEDDILAAMRVLPSAAVARIKDWEANRGDDAREAIAQFNVGFREAADDRTSGRLSPEESDEVDDDKPVRKIRTRELDAETGEFQFGEGITGSGDPPVAPGTTAAAEEAEDGSENKLQSARRAGGRAGRRARPKPTKPASESSSEGESA